MLLDKDGQPGADDSVGFVRQIVGKTADDGLS